MTDLHLPDRPWKPNLFVVGAPKCGTTSLCHYLGQHPEIFISRQKEPLFFCTDQAHDEPWRISEPDRYLAQFEPGAAQKWRGEGSVWYLVSAVAAKHIHAYSPDARIVIMLRNPVDMAVSLHAQFLFSGNESIADFEKAYGAQDARRRGMRLPPRAHMPAGLQYTAVGRYADQVERYLDTFSSNQVKVLIFEEFFADPACRYREVLEFLDVDAGFSPDLSARNKRHNVRSPALQRLLIKAPELWRLPALVRPRRLREGVQRRMERVSILLREYNESGLGDASPSDVLRRRLHADFADDIERLESMLGRDLWAWKKRNLGSPPPQAQDVPGHSADTSSARA